DEVVSLLEKEKENLKTIESLKSNGFESSENEISESENQNENDCHVVEKECDKVANPKVIVLGMFKLSVSQSVLPMSMSKTSCEYKNVEKASSSSDDEKIFEVIGLGYTLMFLTRFDEALEIEKFKRSKENKIEFAYDYGNLNACYVNEKINFEDDYFQEITNPDFEKIDSLFQQTSSLKPYVSNVILEKIIIDLEDEVVNLLEKEKANLETIESLKSKGFESSESGVSESKNQNENDCHKIVIKKRIQSVKRPKHSSVVWKKKGSSNTSNVGLSAVSVSNLNKNVKRYSRKDLLVCNNSHLGETSSAYMCNDAMNVSCNPRLCDVLDDNNLFIFDD
nr:hypothetical protein [Tanacetum cinerariifolium]